MEKALVFTSPGCESCEEVKQHVVDGCIGGVPVELVDVTDDAGFERFMAELERSGTDTIAIPSAFHNGKQCDLRFFGKELSMQCPD